MKVRYTRGVNGFLRRLLDYGTLDRAMRVVERQHKLIDEWQVAFQQQELQHARNVRNLVEQFLIVQSEGVDVRDDLIKGLQDLNDHVARLEEHSSV